MFGASGVEVREGVLFLADWEGVMLAEKILGTDGAECAVVLPQGRKIGELELDLRASISTAAKSFSRSASSWRAF